MRRWLTRIMNAIQSANRGVLIVSYVVIIAVCFMAVIFRYLLNDSLTWAEEFARYLFIAMVFLGGAYVILDDGHLRMDVLYTSVPRVVRRAIDAITVACGVFFLAGRRLGRPGECGKPALEQPPTADADRLSSDVHWDCAGPPLPPTGRDVWARGYWAVG
jgi:hypothetical protein